MTAIKETPIRLSMPDDEHEHFSDDGNLATQEAKPKLKKPPMYRVVLINDDYTPMDFVIEVLIKFFNMDSDRATDVMFRVHHEGRAVCGTYPADIAYTKVEQVNRYARDNEHPLLCSCEQE